MILILTVITTSNWNTIQSKNINVELGTEKGKY